MFKLAFDKIISSFRLQNQPYDARQLAQGVPGERIKTTT
jgi:hypothetical protein